MEESLKLLTEAVWRAHGNEGACPPKKCLEFRKLDDLISTTAWGDAARDEFFRRWTIVEKTANRRFEVGSFAELAYLAWEEASRTDKDTKHPLAPLIHAWQSGPKEVLPVRDAGGNLRGDTILPRISMRDSGAQADRLYLRPAHVGLHADGTQIALPGFGDSNTTSRTPLLPIGLYDLGVEASEARGGRGAAPIPARMLGNLAAAPSAFVRPGRSTRPITCLR